MHSVFFWKSWVPSYRPLLYALTIIFLFALLFLWLGYFQGADGVIHWEKFQEQKIVETTVHEFRLGPFVLDCSWRQLCNSGIFQRKPYCSKYDGGLHFFSDHCLYGHHASLSHYNVTPFLVFYWNGIIHCISW